MTTKDSKSLLKYSYIRNFFRDFFLSIKLISDNLGCVDELVRTHYMLKNDPASGDGKSDFSLKHLEAEYHEKIGVGISSFLNDFNKLK